MTIKRITLLFVLQSCFSAFNFMCAQDLSQQIEKIFNESDIPGMAAAIFTMDSMLYEKELGFSDISNQKTYTLNTTLNIASISKTFIGVALMKLYEEGKIDLDADINEYLPFDVRSPHFPNTPISLRHLATHTSSINDRLGNYHLKAYYIKGNEKISRKGLPLVDKLVFKRISKNKKIPLGEFLKTHLSEEGASYKKKSFLKSEPGTKEAYTNLGAALAGYVIELVSGMPYGDYVKTQILNPLEMNSSDWFLNEINRKHYTTKYINKTAIADYGLSTYPDGGLISSTNDLVKFCRHMIRGYNGGKSILSKASFTIMMGKQSELNSINSEQGIFWDISEEQGTFNVGHDGADPGVTTLMFFNPIAKIGCVLTTNCSSENQNQVKKAIKIWEALIKYKNNLNL